MRICGWSSINCMAMLADFILHQADWCLPSSVAEDFIHSFFLTKSLPFWANTCALLNIWLERFICSHSLCLWICSAIEIWGIWLPRCPCQIGWCLLLLMNLFGQGFWSGVSSYKWYLPIIIIPIKAFGRKLNVLWHKQLTNIFHTCKYTHSMQQTSPN